MSALSYSQIQQLESIALTDDGVLFKLTCDACEEQLLTKTKGVAKGFIERHSGHPTFVHVERKEAQG